MSVIDKTWYQDRSTLLSLALLPLSSLFALISSRRREKYRKRQELGDLYSPKVPVVIVGGICVGGSGKTPLSVALLKHLASKGFRPGLISRGYRGQASRYPFEVSMNSDPALCGDEPLLIKRAVGEQVTVMVDPVRSRGVKALERSGCDVIVSDDGMQHYALERDVEIMVVDAQRLFGNRHLMPAGPLREGMWRASTVDLTVYNGAKPADDSGYLMTLKPLAPKPLSRDPSASLNPGCEVCAMAGIGNPERFYRTVSDLGFTVAATVEVQDHHRIADERLRQEAALRPVVMTAKDAVKYSGCGIDNLFVIEVEGCLEDEFFDRVETLIREAASHPERRSLTRRFSNGK